jgi:hypothetical protein
VNWSVRLATVAVVVLLFSQFGRRLAAKNSVVWWFVAVFLVTAAWVPEAMEPLARLFGVSFVSNFFLGSMVIFLLVELVQQSTFSTEQARKLRQFVCEDAAERYATALGEQSAAPRSSRRYVVVVPCYNEEAALPPTLERLQRLASDGEFEALVCIVNDGSSDATDTILRRKAHGQHTTHKVNVGVAGALLTGFKVAKRVDADFIVQCDADGQHPVEAIPRFVARAAELGADLLVGSRFARTSLAPSDGSASRALESTTLARRAGALLILAALRLFRFHSTVTDPTSGFRVYSRRAGGLLLANMPDEYPEPESIALLAVHGARIHEVRVDMQPRTLGRSSIQGLRSVQYMIKVMTALLGLRLRTLRM